MSKWTSLLITEHSKLSIIQIDEIFSSYNKYLSFFYRGITDILLALERRWFRIYGPPGQISMLILSAPPFYRTSSNMLVYG